MGHRSELRSLAKRVLMARGFRSEWSAAARAQVDALTRGVPIPRDARDLRALPWCSIDNDDSRDLDQLTVGRAEEGGFRVMVAIADVAGLVDPGSPIDGHAHANTTSIYTPGTVFPMLPERLSTDLTSLNEDEDRSAVVVSMLVTPDGEVREGEVFRAAVRNHAKLAYDGVAAWLEAPESFPRRLAQAPGIAAVLMEQTRAAQALRRHRHERGALDLQMIEPRAVFEGDDLVDVVPDRHNRAKEIIEEFMVAANGVVARFLEDRGLSSLRRVVRTPERWDRIVAVAAEHGYELPRDPDSGALSDFLAAERRRDPLRFPDLSLIVVKLIGSGEYLVDRGGRLAEGHFGLAVHDYAHSTAPNRRYPDLVTQRLVQAALGGARSPYSDGDLRALAAHCTQKEDEASRVERHLRKSAAALLLDARIGDTFDGIITGASGKGTWVRIFHPPVEGKVVQGEKGSDVGERVRVRLLATNVARGFIDFARHA